MQGLVFTTNKIRNELTVTNPKKIEIVNKNQKINNYKI